MQRIAEDSVSGDQEPEGRFDLRLAMPLATAVVIALAGYLSLRSPSLPGAVVIDTLPAEDLSVLIDVAADLVPAEELLPDVQAGPRDAAEGAIEAEWISADDAPNWDEFDSEELEILHGFVG